MAVTTKTKMRTQNGEKVTTKEYNYTMADGSVSTKSLTNSEKLAIKPEVI